MWPCYLPLICPGVRCRIRSVFLETCCLWEGCPVHVCRGCEYISSYVISRGWGVYLLSDWLLFCVLIGCKNILSLLLSFPSPLSGLVYSNSMGVQKTSLRTNKILRYNVNT